MASGRRCPHRLENRSGTATRTSPPRSSGGSVRMRPNGGDRTHSPATTNIRSLLQNPTPRNTKRISRKASKPPRCPSSPISDPPTSTGSKSARPHFTSDAFAERQTHGAGLLRVFARDPLGSNPGGWPQRSQNVAKGHCSHLTKSPSPHAPGGRRTRPANPGSTRRYRDRHRYRELTEKNRVRSRYTLPASVLPKPWPQARRADRR